MLSVGSVASGLPGLIWIMRDLGLERSEDLGYSAWDLVFGSGWDLELGAWDLTRRLRASANTAKISYSWPCLRVHKTVGVRVGNVQVGGGAPVVVQSMTMTDTADAKGTAQQCIELAEAGSEMVRVTVNVPAAAEAVPEIKQRMLDAGVTAPLIGDFHYNGHLLLTRYPDCARALDKYRINPGNVGTGRRRDEQFSTICGVARDHGKPVRIGVNGGSLNQELVVAKMQENTDRDLGRDLRGDHQRVHGALRGPVDRARARIGPAPRSDHHLVQDLTPEGSDRRVPRAVAAHRSAAAPGSDRSGHGHEGPGLVRRGDGRRC